MMQTKLTSIDEKHYVINPITVKSGSKRMLSVTCSGISHIIVITDSLMREPDVVFGSDVKTCISEILSRTDKSQPDFQNEELGIKGLQISCISYLQYQINGQSWEVADKAQRILVCGMLCNDSEAVIYLPTKSVRCYSDIRLEMKYKKMPVIINKTVKTGIFGKTVVERQDTGFELVMFEMIQGYSDGMISYDVELKGHKYTIPVTQEMTGKPLMIKRIPGTPLVFNANGLTLSQVKEIK